jgi:hypothetical protein
MLSSFYRNGLFYLCRTQSANESNAVPSGIATHTLNRNESKLTPSLLLFASSSIGHTFYWSQLVLVPSSIGHTFYWSQLLLVSSSIGLIFYWSHLLLVSSSIGLIFYWSHLLLVPASIGLIFYWSHLLLVPSSIGHTFYWSHLLLVSWSRIYWSHIGLISYVGLTSIGHNFHSCCARTHTRSSTRYSSTRYRAPTLYLSEHTHTPAYPTLTPACHSVILLDTRRSALTCLFSHRFRRDMHASFAHSCLNRHRTP